MQNGTVTADRTTGRLLVSTPQLDDGVFHRSVILMLQHGDDGAQGVVLNKPLGAEVDAVLPGWGEHIAAPRTLFQGGPGATGRSYSDGDLIKDSIRSQLFRLPDETVVHTGHGDDTTIAAEREALG